MSAAPHPVRLRDIATPEGLPLRFEVAGAGSRIGAFVLDWILLVAALLVASCGLGFLGVVSGSGFASALLFLVLFVIRNFYFVLFEVRWSGRTPGKRVCGIRVIDAGGGPLHPEAVLARNLMRELEVFLPLALVAAPESVFPGADIWQTIFCSLWALGCAIFPLFNADRRRLGDLVAGTLVVRAPAAALLPDLTAVPAPRAAPRLMAPGAVEPEAAPYRFTREQLSHYGEYELTTLEDVLRKAGPASAQGLRAITERICRRIGWIDDPKPDPVRFLHAFYAAQRAELERRLLLGRRKSDKHQRD